MSLKRSKGIFTSPNYPRHYDTSQRKLWLLPVKSSRCIKLYFKHFNLSPCSNSVRCECDYIRIGEGRNNSVALYGEYCGQSKPSKFVSRGAQLWVEFVSDSNFTSTGFQAIYEETQCIAPTNALKQGILIFYVTNVLYSSRKVNRDFKIRGRQRRQERQRTIALIDENKSCTLECIVVT